MAALTHGPIRPRRSARRPGPPPPFYYHRPRLLPPPGDPRLVPLGKWNKDEGAFLFDAGPRLARLRAERLETSRRYHASAIRFSAVIPDLGIDALRAEKSRDTDVVGSWRHSPAGLSFEVTIPPAGVVWSRDSAAEEMFTWVGRHIVRHVRKSF